MTTFQLENMRLDIESNGLFLRGPQLDKHFSHFFETLRDSGLFTPHLTDEAKKASRRTRREARDFLTSYSPNESQAAFERLEQAAWDIACEEAVAVELRELEEAGICIVAVPQEEDEAFFDAVRDRNAALTKIDAIAEHERIEDEYLAVVLRNLHPATKADELAKERNRNSFPLHPIRGLLFKVGDEWLYLPDDWLVERREELYARAFPPIFFVEMARVARDLGLEEADYEAMDRMRMQSEALRLAGDCQPGAPAP